MKLEFLVTIEAENEKDIYDFVENDMLETPDGVIITEIKGQ